MFITLNEIKDAQKEWKKANQEFMMAEPEFVDAAAFKLTAAEKRYSKMLQKAKKEHLTSGIQS